MTNGRFVRVAVLLTLVDLAACDFLGPDDDRAPRFSVVPLAVVSNLAFESLAAGYAHTCGLTAGGAAFCWGDNEQGQLGDGTGGEFLDHSSVPVPVSGEGRFVAISAGAKHTCALTHGFELYCWGGGGGLCEVGECQMVPVRLDGPPFVSISSAAAAVCGVTASGEVFCSEHWSDGASGFARVDVPPMVSVQVGGEWGGVQPFACGLTPNGAVHCWWEPVQLEEQQQQAFSSLAVGAYHVCGIASQVAHCWGRNEFGQLGRGFASGYIYGIDPDLLVPAPVQVPSPTCRWPAEPCTAVRSRRTGSRTAGAPTDAARSWTGDWVTKPREPATSSSTMALPAVTFAGPHPSQ